MEQTKIAELAKARHPLPPEASLIPGWGVDAPIERRVGSPKNGDFTPADNGALWDAPEQQKAKVKIHVSLERPGITPVFGTTCAPKGLSGLIRDWAYARSSEGQRRHWLALIFADRVDAMECLVTDLVFHPPEAKNGPRKIRRETVIAAGAALALGAFFVARKMIADEKNRA